MNIRRRPWIHGLAAALLTMVAVNVSARAEEWKAHEVRQLGEPAGGDRTPAKLQIVTESWNRVVGVPYIVGRTWNLDSRYELDRFDFLREDGSWVDGVCKYIGRRNSLVISPSHDGTTFDRAFVIHAEPTTMRFPGKNIADGWQYLAAIVWHDHLYVICSVNKEDVGVARIGLSSLVRRHP